MSEKSSRFLTLASLAIIGGILYLAQEVLVPIALAVLLSFLLAPLVTRLERLKFPRVLAVLSSVVLTLGVVAGVGVIVYNELADLAPNIPQYRTNIEAKAESMRGSFSFLAGFKRANEEVQHLLTPATNPATQVTTQKGPPVPVVLTGGSPSVGGESNSPLSLIGTFGQKILGPVGSFFIVIVLTTFMLLGREDLRDRLISLVGRNRLTVTTEAMDDAANRVSRYLLMQLIINGSVGVVVMIALWSIGKFNGEPFPSPALWGLLAALLRFIPYVGIWIAAITPLLLSLAVFSSAKVALETLIAYVAVELIAANALEPLLFGSSTGIATLAVLVAALFWTWLWGTAGLLLATPLTVCLVVLGKHVPQLKFLTIMLGDAPPLEPPDRVYQRLLALDEEEAANLVNEYARKMPIEALYDTVVMPTLLLLEQDQRLGNLDEEHVTTIHRGLKEIVEDVGHRQRAARAKVAAQETVDLAKRDKEGASPVTPEPEPDVKTDGRYMLPKDCKIKIAALPAHDDSDEIAAIMFAQLLEIRGYCVAVVSIDKLTSERVTALEELSADLVCISSLPPAALSHARYLHKRIKDKLPDLGVMVGLWMDPGDLKRVRDRIGDAQTVQVAADLRTALDVVHQMVQSKVVSSGVGAS